MLTVEETYKLFDLLEHLHSGKRFKRDKKTLVTWRETLQDWSYEQVREAAYRRGREGNRFFPDAPEIAAYCPPVAEKTAEAPQEKLRSDQCELLKKHESLIKKRRKAGLPATLEEARQQGLSALDWNRILGSAELGLEAIL